MNPAAFSHLGIFEIVDVDALQNELRYVFKEKYNDGDPNHLSLQKVFIFQPLQCSMWFHNAGRFVV